MNANLSKNVLKYKPFPSSELRQQFSKLSISSIAYCVEEAIENTVCTISCNFIQSEKDEDSYIESYEVPLQSFLLNTTPKNYNLHSFSVVWFYINSPKEELIFTIKDFKNEIVKKDINVQLTINFQWIQDTRNMNRERFKELLVRDKVWLEELFKSSGTIYK